MPRFLNAFCSSLAASASSCGNERREHLEDRHLAAEVREDRCELAADDAAAEHDEPARHLGLREQARGVDAARRVEPRNRRSHRIGAGGDDGALERDVLGALDRDRGGAREPALALDPLDAVCLQEARDAARHLLDDAVLPGGGLREVELRLGHADAELRERLAGVVQRVRGLHPGLGGDTADPEARASDLGLLLDAHDLATELGGANRSRVSRRPSSEDGDVTFHSGSTFRR